MLELEFTTSGLHGTKEIEMTEPTQSEELLNFFKALADANRLKIVGLLAQKAFTVEELAKQLGLSASTTSHHLARLAKAGLVAARTEGHYYYYSLQTEILKEMSQRLLHDENLPRLSDEVGTDAYERKVLETFIDANGRITAFPAQEKKFQVLLRFVLRAFEPGVRYSEKQVIEILLRFNEDTASLRRGMIEYHLMEREGGGGAYWRI
jgi:predicted transcriptional regulator